VASRLQDTHKRYNEAVQELIPTQRLELNKSGVVARSMKLMDEIFDRVHEEKERLRQEFMAPHLLFAAKIEEMKETQRQIEYSADHIATLISQYETLAFPADLCSLYQKELPDFDDSKCKIHVIHQQPA
jgi:hypothetical protein